MKYRKMDNLGIETSLLGFGCMRFICDEKVKVKEDIAFDLIRKAYDNGVTYFDSAYVYLDGQSERVMGKALSCYKRDSYYMATKLPTWMVSSKERALELFDEQLERLGTDYIDFYLLHSMNRGAFDDLCKKGVIELCEDLQRQGKIKYFGFSFHDDYSAFEHIITYRKWDFCQIQYNYMDEHTQATSEGVKLAGKLGVPLVIMEPIKGGMLSRLPDDVMEVLDKGTPAGQPKRSASSWALRWVATQPEVKVILSGMNTDEQLTDNLATFADFEPLSDAEVKTVETARATILSRVRNGCTGCRYCMPCPGGVDIPRVFAIWNEYGKYGLEHIKGQYRRMRPDTKPDVCLECGACEGKCPQKLSIIDNLKQAKAELS